MSFDAMWLLVLCHVTWCNAMSCDVCSCDELSSVVPCNGIERYELYCLRCHWLRGHLCGSKWFCDDVVIQSAILYVLPSTTLCYKVLLQYYSVLQRNAHDWPSSHMKRHLQCAEQQVSPSNLTKYYACHAKWLSWLILLTYETSFPMRGATRSNRHHPPTSPNIAAATQNCNPTSKRNLPKTVEASLTMRGLFDHDPNMKLQNWTRPFAEGGKYNMSRSGIYQNFSVYCACHCNITKYCACHEKWHCNITKYCTCHEKCHCNITKCCACHKKSRSSIIKNCACQEKFAENGWSDRGLFDHDPDMKLQNWTRPFAEVAFPPRQRIWYWKSKKVAPRLAIQISAHTAPMASDAAKSQNTAPATKKWHCNITKSCACHEKRHCNITKYCTCHKRWPPSVTK